MGEEKPIRPIDTNSHIETKLEEYKSIWTELPAELYGTMKQAPDIGAVYHQALGIEVRSYNRATISPDFALIYFKGQSNTPFFDRFYNLGFEIPKAKLAFRGRPEFNAVGPGIELIHEGIVLHTVSWQGINTFQ